MLAVKEVQRNHRGQIVRIDLNDGRRMDPKQLFETLKHEKIWGAYIDTDTNGNKQLHITSDSDSDANLDILTLI